MYANTIISVLALAAAAVAAPAHPRDNNAGCSAASLGNFAWTVKGFSYNASYVFTTPSHQVSSGVVGFQLTNPALKYPALCTGRSSQLQDFFYGTVTYDCTLPEGAASTATATSFTYNYPARELNVTQTWSCSDANPKQPMRFAYDGPSHLQLACSETSSENPNWKEGETYSVRDVRCTQGDFSIVPTTKQAIA